jgi:polyisoprenoid-binding protein YceI
MAIHSHPIVRAAASVALAAAFAASAHAGTSTAKTYAIDLTRSSFKFAFTQAGAENQGRFRKYTVGLRFDDKNLAASKLEVTVLIDSLDTGDEQRDEALRGTDLFNVAKFPEARFTSSKVNRVAAGRYEAVGKLTLRGVTRNLVVPFSLRETQEKAGAAAYMTGRATLNRLDFGVGQGEWKSTEQVANEVTANFSLRLNAAAN